MTDTEWLTVPQLTEILGLTPSRVRRLIEERTLPATRIDGVLRVPADVLVDGAPMPEIPGTVTLLLDAGFDDDEVVRWLLDDEPSLGATPIAALRAGRKAEVRRVAQALA